MTQNNISLSQALILGIMVAVITALTTVTFMPRADRVAGVSPVGTSFGTAKFAAITFSLASATSTSLINTDASDRYITGMRYTCTGVGTSQTAYTGAGLTSNGLLFKASTSSATTAGQAVNITNTTSLAFSTYIATTTVGGIAQMASSTIALGALPGWVIWPAGVGLTMFTNATNTAACTAGVDYIGS